MASLKMKTVVCFVNSYFCSGFQRDANSSTNHQLPSLFSSATVTMCLCVAPTGRATRTSVTCGRLRANNRVRYLWCQKDRVLQVCMWPSLKTFLWILNPKIPSCVSYYLQINNSDSILPGQATDSLVQSIALFLLSFYILISLNKKEIVS